MRLFAIFFSFSIIFYGCSSNKFIRDIDYEAEFEKGKLALSNKKYVRAQDHFNTVVIGASHTELGDDALFYLGETYFYMGDKLLAIAEYDKLIRRMSFSPYLEKARYRICESYVTLSPKYFRDQTYSEKAIEKLQEFIDDYPNSSNREEAQKNIKILRNKLSRKIYDTGILYIKMEEYKSALIAFKQVVDLYYDTDYNELAHMKTIACYIYRNEFDEARKYYDEKRKFIVEIKLIIF